MHWPHCRQKHFVQEIGLARIHLQTCPDHNIRSVVRDPGWESGVPGLVLQPGIRGLRTVQAIWRLWRTIGTLQGLLKLQRALSLLGSNLASAGVLRPTAVSATCSLELGTDLGIIRYVPSIN